LFAILGICLNVLVIVALMHYRRTRRHVTTPFIISLSISDLVYSGIILPIMAARFANQDSPLGDTMCRVYPLIYYGTMGASLLSLTMVTLNRAFMLFLPSKVDSIFTNNKDIKGHKVPINRMSVATLEERKMERLFMLMLGLIFVFFVVTYVPGIIVKGADKCFTKPTLHVLAYVINWASVWINPIIYVVSQKKYQDAIRHLKDTFKKCGPGAQENKQHIPSFQLNSGSDDPTTEENITRHPTVTNKHLDSLQPKTRSNSDSRYSSGIGSTASTD